MKTARDADLNLKELSSLKRKSPDLPVSDVCSVLQVGDCSRFPRVACKRVCKISFVLVHE